MLDIEQAKAVALTAARRLSNVEVQLRLLEERSFGWVFAFVGANGQPLVGNAPVIVDRTSGHIITTGTAYPTEWYVHAFESLGEERFTRGEWRRFIQETYEVK